MTVRLGRLWAHGTRYRRGTPEVGVGEVLARLGDRQPVARSLLVRAARATGALGVVVRPEETEVAQVLADAGVVRVEERVQGTVLDHRWLPRRAVVPADMTAEVAEVLGRLDPGEERRRLIEEMGEEAFLAGELGALEAEAPDQPLRPPPGSVLAGSSWSVYSAAVRAAVCWLQAERAGERLSERELAARALGWSKAWTPARRRAFEILVGRPFSEAVTSIERLVRVAGPLRWRLGAVHGDARSGHPWIGIPEGSVPLLETVEAEAERVLVIENLESFEEAVRAGAATEAVVVYGGGYVGEAVVTLLTRIRLAVAAWCDLDPHGVRIAADLSRRVGREVSPVGMDPELLFGPHARPATSEQLADAATAAATLPQPWSVIAAAMVETGRVCEQEALHAEVIRTGRL